MSEIQEPNTDEIAAQKYLSGEIDLDTLTDEQADLAHEMFTKAGADNTEGEQSTEEEAKQGQEETPGEEKKEEIAPLDQNQRIAELLAEKNRLQQIADDREGKLKSLKEDPNFRAKFLGEEVKVEVDPNKDYLDDEHQAKIEAYMKRIELLEQRENERQEKDVANQRMTEVERETNNLFNEINQLQGEFPQLKTSENFQKIDSKFVAWKQAAILGNVDTDEYIKSAEYRKSVDAKGYKLDVSPEDMNKAMKIYDAHTKYKQAKAEGYKTSLSREFKETPDYINLMKSKFAGHQVADDDALAAKIAERSTEVQIMGASNGGVGQVEVNSLIDEMTMLSHKTNFTDKDQQRFNEISKILDNIG